MSLIYTVLQSVFAFYQGIYNKQNSTLRLRSMLGTTFPL